MWKSHLYALYPLQLPTQLKSRCVITGRKNRTTGREWEEVKETNEERDEIIILQKSAATTRPARTRFWQPRVDPGLHLAP